METNEAVRKMLESSGMSMYRASLAMGKAHSYVSVMLTRSGGIGAPTLAHLADVCGYDLLLVDRMTGDTIKLDTKQ